MAGLAHGRSAFPSYPKKVQFGDITIRDGFQHEEKIISTEAKVFYAEELILAGIRYIEATNYGNPNRLPQFRDADEVLKRIRGSRKLKDAGVDMGNIVLTAVTIREKAVDRAIAARNSGWGPDRVLMMVSTDEHHHFVNSGCTLLEYWKEAERCIRKVKDAGMKFCGTVSTIWGSPIAAQPT
jgi:hydroxymethylglutaryl-CoA lyase